MRTCLRFAQLSSREFDCGSRGSRKNSHKLGANWTSTATAAVGLFVFNGRKTIGFAWMQKTNSHRKRASRTLIRRTLIQNSQQQNLSSNRNWRIFEFAEDLLSESQKSATQTQKRQLAKKASFAVSFTKSILCVYCLLNVVLRLLKTN